MNQIKDWMKSWGQQQASQKEQALSWRRALHPVLVEKGVEVVTCSYSGSGDSGQIDEVALQPEFEDWKKLEVGNVINGELVTMTLREALARIFDTLLDTTHGGWENNDGGEGSFEWKIDTNTLTLEHAQFYTEANHSSTEF